MTPEGWQLSTLGQHLREPIKNGYSPNCPASPTGKWIAHLGAVTERGFTPTAVKPAPPDDPKVDASRLVPGDLLVSRSNTRDRVGLAGIYRGAPAPCSYPDLLMRVRPSDDVDAEFLLHSLLSERGRDYFRRVARGTSGSMVKVDRSLLESFPLLLPPVAEQRRIAAALSVVDDALQKARAVCRQHVEVKLAVMAARLSRGKWDRRRGNVSGHKHHEVLLDDVAVRGSGHTPDKKHPEYWNGGIPWVSLRDSSKLDHVLIRETAAEISQEGIDNSSAVLHPAGTVVLTRDAGVGKAAILASKMAVSQHFMAWRCGPGLDRYYLYYWLQHMKPVFEAIASGNTIKTIGLPFFKQLRVPLPAIDEQHQVSRALLAVDEALAASEEHAGALGDLKHSLASALLSGRACAPASERS